MAVGYHWNRVIFVCSEPASLLGPIYVFLVSSDWNPLQFYLGSPDTRPNTVGHESKVKRKGVPKSNGATCGNGWHKQNVVDNGIQYCAYNRWFHRAYSKNGKRTYKL